MVHVYKMERAADGYSNSVTSMVFTIAETSSGNVTISACHSQLHPHGCRHPDGYRCWFGWFVFNNVTGYKKPFDVDL